MHDIPSVGLWKYKRKFSSINCNIIAISNYQKQIIQTIWQGNWWHKIIDKNFPVKSPKIEVIYNPISDSLQQDATQVIDNKLLFFSAPDRGIEQILILFNKVKQQIKDFELFIAHPGYAKLDDYQTMLKQPGINVLGSLSNHELIQHIREAFCIFYPQNKRQECFGLVFAESNAVGTPVLAHDFGAAREVLSSEEQLINAEDEAQVIERLQTWRDSKRPEVTLKKQFRSDAVLAQWDTVLNE